MGMPGTRAGGPSEPQPRRLSRSSVPPTRHWCLCYCDSCHRPPRLTKSRSAGARSAFGCWSKAFATTPSSCSTRRDVCTPGTPAPSASRATAPTRSSASTSRGSIRPKRWLADCPSTSSKSRPKTRQLRGRRLARSQGRLAVLGQRRHHRAARSGRRAVGLCQGHARPDAAAQPRRGICGRAKSGSACWSKACATTRSSCSTPTDVLRRGTSARSASRATRPTRSSASTSRCSIPPTPSKAAGPSTSSQVAAESGSFVDEGWRLRKDGTRFWANVTITALRDAPRSPARVRQADARPHRAQAHRGFEAGRTRSARRSWTPNAARA